MEIDSFKINSATRVLRSLLFPNQSLTTRSIHYNFQKNCSFNLFSTNEANEGPFFDANE
jgi:hypothetical protein